MDQTRAKSILSQLQPGAITTPENVRILSALSLKEREEFSKLSQTLVVYLGEEVGWVKSAEEEAVLRAAPRGYPIDSLNGLNIGCGDRLISPYLLPIDVMRSAPDEAISGTHHALSAGALLAMPDNLPFKPGSVDYIVALHMLEHVEHPETIIKYWLEILKPGGGIGIVVPNWKYTWDSRKDKAPLGHKWNPTPDLVKSIYDRSWKHLAELEHIDTLPYKISFDFVLRKRGEFVPFSLPKADAMKSGWQRNEEGIFLHGD